MFHLKNHRRILCNHAVLLRILINHTPHHHIDDVVLGGLLRNQGSHISAVPHNRYAVRNHLDFIHTVGYVYNTKLLFPQIPDNLKQLFYFRFRERRRRLVKNNYLRVM